MPFIMPEGISDILTLDETISAPGSPALSWRVRKSRDARIYRQCRRNDLVYAGYNNCACRIWRSTAPKARARKALRLGEAARNTRIWNDSHA